MFLPDVLNQTVPCHNAEGNNTNHQYRTEWSGVAVVFGRCLLRILAKKPVVLNRAVQENVLV